MASLSRSILGTARTAVTQCGRCAAVTAVPARARMVQARSLVSTASRWAEVRPGPALSQTNRAEATLRRFWKTVNIKEEDGGSVVTLDHRNLRTPGGKKLVIPSDKRLLAALIAHEWDIQEETSLASRALDGMSDEKIRSGVIDHLVRYIATDTICFPDDSPEPLVRLQQEHWDPLFTWLKEEYSITLSVAEGFSPARQSQETVDQLKALVEGMDHWELACFERAVYATKSFVIGLALIKGRLSANGAAEAAHVEVRSQIERWGEVEDTHDVDYQDIRRALGSVSCLLINA